MTYEPHIIGMYSRGFRDYRKALETHWQAYLDGEIPSIEAMRRILVDTTEVKQ